MSKLPQCVLSSAFSKKYAAEHNMSEDIVKQMINSWRE